MRQSGSKPGHVNMKGGMELKALTMSYETGMVLNVYNNVSSIMELENNQCVISCESGPEVIDLKKFQIRILC